MMARLPIVWIVIVVVLALASTVAFSPEQRAGDWDSSLLPPGATDASGVARSLVSASLSSDRTNLDVDALASESQLYEAIPEEPRHGLIEQLSMLDPPIAPRQAEQIIADVIEPLGKTYYLGTDSLGRDVLARLVHGARTALLVGVLAASIATALGILIGMLMGLGHRWLDALLMRCTEAVMSVPLLYVLVLAAGVLPRSTLVVMALIGCLSWHTAARYVRAECMRLRGADFVDAARGTGAGRVRVALRHILPNAAAPVIVDTSFAAAGAILVEATLSFLGLGGESVSWGSIMRDATIGGAGVSWWLALYPGLMIFLTALSFVLLGERLRDRLDPRTGARSGARAGGWAYTAKA